MVVLDSVLAHMMVFLYTCSSGINAHMLRALEGHRVGSKALQGSETETRELLERTKESNILLAEWSVCLVND